jgi:hypothetical protein
MDLITREHFAYAAVNVPVTENPTLSTNPFFKIMVKHNFEAYYVLQHLGISAYDDEVLDKKVWTWNRFGRTVTVLPDGRQIGIGGEHEDLCVVPIFFNGRVLIYCAL